MGCEQRIADERHGVDQRMRDDHRVRPPPAKEQRSEDDTHDHVADERAEPLVQMIRAPEHGADCHGSSRAQAEESQPAQQVADNQDLL